MGWGCSVSKQTSFKILQDVAKDLSGDKVSFPTFLDITFQVRTALKNPSLNVEQLAQLVSAEPLMSAKIISMSNSDRKSTRDSSHVCSPIEEFHKLPNHNPLSYR